MVHTANRLDILHRRIAPVNTVQKNILLIFPLVKKFTVLRFRVEKRFARRIIFSIKTSLDTVSLIVCGGGDKVACPASYAEYAVFGKVGHGGDNHGHFHRISDGELVAVHKKRVNGSTALVPPGLFNRHMTKIKL